MDGYNGDSGEPAEPARKWGIIGMARTSFLRIIRKALVPQPPAPSGEVISTGTREPDAPAAEGDEGEAETDG